MVAGGVGIFPWQRVVVFGRNYHLLSMTLNELAYKLFARSHRVKIGRVNEISTRFAIGFIDCSCLFFGRAPAPLLAEGHGSKRQLRHPQAAVSQKSIVHPDATPN